jgi:hypothetical protein
VAQVTSCGARLLRRIESAIPLSDPAHHIAVRDDKARSVAGLGSAEQPDKPPHGLVGACGDVVALGFVLICRVSATWWRPST